MRVRKTLGQNASEAFLIVEPGELEITFAHTYQLLARQERDSHGPESRFAMLEA